MTLALPAAQLADDDAVRRAMHELRGLGVGLALDHAGTGTVRLDLLAALPFTALIVDETFDAAAREARGDAFAAATRDGAGGGWGARGWAFAAVGQDGAHGDAVGRDGVCRDAVGRDGVGRDGAGGEAVGRDGVARDGVGRDGAPGGCGAWPDGAARRGSAGCAGVAAARRAAFAAAVVRFARDAGIEYRVRSETALQESAL